MSGLDRNLLGEKTEVVDRHLGRVAAKLPPAGSAFEPMTDASDAVMFHLWLATQVVLDLAVSASVACGLGAPKSYAEAFRKLAAAGKLESTLAERLVQAAGFRNIISHAYDTVDLAQIRKAATDGPADLRAFLGALARAAT